MNQSCFVCNNRVGVTQRHALNIFKECTAAGKTLANVLSEVLDKSIPETSLYSNVICKKCHKNCMDYDTVRTRLQVIKSDLLTQFKSTLTKHDLHYDKVNWEPASPIKIEVKPEKGSVKRLVLPASKLQPLPPDYVISVGKLNSAICSSLKVPTMPRITSVSSTTTSTVNLKVTVGSSVLTQSIKTTPANKSLQKPSSSTSSPSKMQEYVSNIINITQATSPTTNLMSFNVNSMPKDFLSSAVLTKIDHVAELKDEMKNEDENNEESMEIDEGLTDCTLLHVANDDVQIDLSEEKDKSSDQTSQYYDVPVLPASDSEGQSGGDELVLRELTVLSNDDDEDEQTIVMAGENGSILRVVPGQKLVYEGGEISLVADDDNSNQGEDHDGGNDSNDESQIELQVSGDEETANAIIAAAQEQGGAFIKVESGEMFRVKSVKSKTEIKSGVNEMQAIVAQDGNEFKCLLCEKLGKDSISSSSTPWSGDAERIMQHMRSEHDARVYVCQFCKKIMRRRAEYTRHLEEHAAKCRNLTPADKSKMHECDFCKKKYSSRTLLAEHMNIHSGTRPYVCTACSKSFASKYTYQAHLKTHLERPRPHKCSLCPKSFLTVQNLKQHENTHSGVKDFVCNVCGKAFGTQHNLEVHGVVHSGSRPFVCGVCGKAFARRAEVRDHMRTHTGERPFKCDICDASFAQRSNLLSHKRATHMNDKRYQCNDCPKRFKRRRLLEYHIKAAHTGERPLQCAVCHATFVYPEHYKKHIRIHSGDRPFVCEVCGKSFNSRDNRNTHRFVHSDKKPYECLVCGAGYMRKQLLYAHMNSSGHLAESIVVNQPRVQKVTEKIASSTASDIVDAIKLKPDRLDTIFESTQEIELNSADTKSILSTTGDGPKLFITNDKKLILQDGKSTINLVQDSEDPTLITLQNMDEGEKVDQGEIMQGVTMEQISDQTEMVASTEDGGMMRLVQIQLSNGTSGWVAIS